MSNSRKGVIAVVGSLVAVAVIVGYLRYGWPERIKTKIELMFCPTPRQRDYAPAPPERTVQFGDSSAGQLYRTSGKGDGEFYTITGTHWKPSGQAASAVHVPASVGLKLKVDWKSVDLSRLSKLGPNDLQAVDFSPPYDTKFDLWVPNQTKRILNLPDEQLKYLSHLTGLYQLNLSNTTITNEGLTHLQNLKSLRSLNLFTTKISDDGLVYLKSFPGLRELYLGATDITDEGMKHIAGLISLKCLSLTTGRRTRETGGCVNSSAVNERITDNALVYIKNIKSLKELILRNTNISDAGIQHIHGLEFLTRLDVSGTKVSETAIKRLKKVLSKCEVIKEKGIRINTEQ
jgi:hypothetical protein